MKNSAAGAAYLSSCQREQSDCALELLNAFNQNAREVQLNHRARPLVDSDLLCIADALRTKHSLRVLNLEDNCFGLSGVQSLIDALVANPGCVRELRLGKNRLKDPSMVALGNALSLNGAGLKVLDMSENSITKLGIVPLSQALSSKFCDLVEVSLHNNAIEADAALPLSQAMRQSSKLKHLHLGYNSLRDSGAVQLARSIPIASTLATLDLTANRIGPQGGMEIAKALLSPNCTLQRLNLRHNNFDDDTFEMFGDVIVKNTSLTQLFLGFMRPSRDTGAQVLSTLRYNRTLVLFDAYGWGVEPTDAWGLLESILSSNPTIRAIVTDAGASIAQHCDQCNASREGSGMHRVYIGPEDRLAYQAAAAAKAAASAATSTGNMKSLGRGDSTTSTVVEPPPYQTSRSASAQNQPGSQSAAGGGIARNVPATRATGSTTPREHVVTPVVHTGTYDKDIDVLLSELQNVHMDAELRRKLVFIVSQLQLKIDTVRSYHQQQLVALEERVRSVEQRQGGGPMGTPGTPTPAAGTSHLRDPSPAVRVNSAVQPADRMGSPTRLPLPPVATTVPLTRPVHRGDGSMRYSPERSRGASLVEASEGPGADGLDGESTVDGHALDATQSPQRRRSSADGGSSDIPRGPHTRPLSPRDRSGRSSSDAEQPPATSRSLRSGTPVGRPVMGGARDGTPTRPGPGGSGPLRAAALANNTPPIAPTTHHLDANRSGRSIAGSGRSASYSEGLSGGHGSSQPPYAQRSSSLYVPPSIPPAVAQPPSEPVDIRESSPANPHLQTSQHKAPHTFIEASPHKQDRPVRKQPPAST